MLGNNLLAQLSELVVNIAQDPHRLPRRQTSNRFESNARQIHVCQRRLLSFTSKAFGDNYGEIE